MTRLHPSEEPGSATTGTTAPLTILVADDEAPIRDMLARALPALGFTAKTAANGAAALDLYGEGQTDLVLLDVQMPIMDGAETLRALKHINPDVICLFMTGGMGQYDAETLFDLGAAAILAKPFHLTELRDVILRALAGR